MVVPGLILEEGKAALHMAKLVRSAQEQGKSILRSSADRSNHIPRLDSTFTHYKMVKKQVLENHQDDDYVFMIGAIGNTPLYITVKLQGIDVKVMADSGSCVNLLDEQTYDKLQPPPKLKRDNIMCQGIWCYIITANQG